MADPYESDNASEVQLANARLIAAAPDLFAALVAIVRVIDRADDRGCPAGALEMARAAIARAEGRRA